MGDLKILGLENQPNEKAFLYRYLTIDKLIDTLVNNRLPLTRLNLFEDKLEGITPEHLLMNFASDKIAEDIAPGMGDTLNLITTNINPGKRNSFRRQRIDFQKYNYANCWFVSDHESIAMWKLYSRHDSVAMKIPYSSFVNQIKTRAFELPGNDDLRLRYGNVQYFNFSILDSFKDLAINEDIQGFVKDKSFQHENEFRIMLSTKPKEVRKAEPNPTILDEQIEDVNNLIDLKTIYFEMVNFKEMPFEIIFHPQSNLWHQENVRNIIKKFDLTFKIYESRLKRIFN